MSLVKVVSIAGIGASATSHYRPRFPSLKILQHQETGQAASDRTADQLYV